MNRVFSLFKQSRLFLVSILAIAVMGAPLVLTMEVGGLVNGGIAFAEDHSSHESGGHTPGGHSSGGHTSGGHSSGGHSSGLVPGAGKGRGKGNPAWDQHGGGRASDPDAERGVGYHGGSTLESKVLRGGAASKGKGGPGGRGGDSHTDSHTDSDTEHTDHEDTDSHDDSHESGSKGRKPENAGKPEGVGGEDDHDH